MRISCTRLLAQLCCNCYLLISVVLVTTARTTPTAAVGVDPREKYDPDFDSSWKKDKCHYSLTDSGHSLEADSSTYQHLGFSKCEYIIHSPIGHFILLNFTGIHINPDMPVKAGARHQLLQEAVTEISATFTESDSVRSAPPQSHEKETVNSSSFQEDRKEELASTAFGIGGGSSYRRPNKSRSHNKHNTGLSQTEGTHSSHKRKHSNHKPSLTVPVHEITINESDTNKASSGVSSEGLHEALRDNGVKPSTASVTSNVDCNSKFVIEDVNRSTEQKPQVVCWGSSWQSRLPLVFHYKVPVRITFVWDRYSRSGFSLDFKFLRPEEVDCPLWCNKHLCLPKQQLCDGVIDCPDRSDEHAGLCTLPTQQIENGEPQVLNVVVIIISVIGGIIIVLTIIFMISHIFCCNGLCRRRDPLLQPPHSQSSEVCRSPSDSIQESGQYESLLHQRPWRQAPVPDLILSSSHHHQQPLQQSRELEVEQHQQQQQNYQHVGHSLFLSPEEQLIPLCSDSAAGVVPRKCAITRSLHCQRQKLFAYEQQQQHLEQPVQQGKCTQGCRYLNPDELYPPNVPVSRDGEEGYAESQRSLHSKQQLEQNWQAQNELFRPPPNKTVYDRDSPPPHVFPQPS